MNFLTIFLRKHFHSVLLLLILLWAVALRLQFMSLPIRYDEAFTYLRYAQLPLTDSLRDYEFPNNHLLHTILVHFSVGLFGGAEWAIRLPTFLASLLSVVALYGLMCRLYDMRVGLVAAMWWAGVGMGVEYATNARGYMLGTCFFLLMLWRPKWYWVGILGAASIYTVPTMLYGMVLVMAWWAAEIWRSEQPKSAQVWDWLRAGLLAGGLSFLLYLPILLTDGLDMILNNPIIVKPTPEQFRAEFPQSLLETFTRWHGLMPLWLAVLLGAGFLASAFWGSAKSKVWLPLASLAILPVLIFQQVLPFPRVWLFLLPLYLGFAAAGWAFLLKKHSIYSLLGLGIAFLLGLSVLAQDDLYALDEVAVLPQAEAILADLQGRLDDNSRLVLVLPSEVILEYYFERHQQADLYQEQTRPQFRRSLYILVNHEFEGQSLPDVFGGMAGYGEAQLIQSFAGASLYQAEWVGGDALQVQMALEWEDLGGRVFSPRTDPDDLLSFIGISETEAEQSAIAEWRSSKEARFLRQAGFQFLLVDGEWLSWLSEDEYQLLADERQYQLIREWRDKNTGEFFRLYSLII